MKHTKSGPLVYKSELGLPAYKNSDNVELYLLSFKFQLDSLTLKEDGTLTEEGNFFLFDGYASTWTLDLGDDIIQQGAFKESLQKRKPKVLFQHDPDILAGFHDTDFEDDIGLRVKGRIPKDGGNTPLLVPYMGEGGIDSLSIGFRIARDDKNEPMMDIINGIRIIKKIELFEYSFVTFPMNPAAKVGLSPEEDIHRPDLEEGKSEKPVGHKELEVKFETIREAENCLKEFGLTSEQSKTVISKIKALSDTRDDEDGDNGVKDEMSDTDFDELKTLMVDCGDTSKEDSLDDDDISDLLTSINSLGE